MENENENDIFFPINFHKQATFPEYDDVTLILKDLAEDVKDVSEDVKNQIIALPDLDDGHFLKKMSKNGLIKILKEETFENTDGSLRKGSTGSIDDYNYQSAYNFYLQLVKKEDFLKVLEKEKENPTDYNIPVKTKKIEKKRYVKTYRYPRRRKR